MWWCFDDDPLWFKTCSRTQCDIIIQVSEKLHCAFCWVGVANHSATTDLDLRVHYFRGFARVLFSPLFLIDEFFSRVALGTWSLALILPSCSVWLTHAGWNLWITCRAEDRVNPSERHCNFHDIVGLVNCELASISVNLAQPNVRVVLLIATNVFVPLCTVRQWVYVTTVYPSQRFSGIRVIWMIFWINNEPGSRKEGFGIWLVRSRKTTIR
jgi:hypothetical protein